MKRKTLSERLADLADDAQDICRNVTTDWRVRKISTNVSTQLKAACHIQARIEAGIISAQLEAPHYRHD